MSDHNRWRQAKDRHVQQYDIWRLFELHAHIERLAVGVKTVEHTWWSMVKSSPCFSFIRYMICTHSWILYTSIRSITRMFHFRCKKTELLSKSNAIWCITDQCYYSNQERLLMTCCHMCEWSQVFFGEAFGKETFINLLGKKFPVLEIFSRQGTLQHSAFLSFLSS